MSAQRQSNQDKETAIKQAQLEMQSIGEQFRKMIARMKASEAHNNYEVCSVRLSDSLYIRFIMKKHIDKIHLTCHYNIDNVSHEDRTENHVIPISTSTEKVVLAKVISCMKKIVAVKS